MNITNEEEVFDDSNVSAIMNERKKKERFIGRWNGKQAWA